MGVLWKSSKLCIGLREVRCWFVNAFMVANTEYTLQIWQEDMRDTTRRGTCLSGDQLLQLAVSVPRTIVISAGSKD